MEEKCCKDCPCLENPSRQMPELDDGSRWCEHGPTWRLIERPQEHYCFLGRKIMDKQESFRKVKESFLTQEEAVAKLNKLNTEATKDFEVKNNE